MRFIELYADKIAPQCGVGDNADKCSSGIALKEVRYRWRLSGSRYRRWLSVGVFEKLFCSS